MTQRAVAWLLLGAWLVWIQALQALWSRHGGLFVPDLGLVLVFSVLARLEAKNAPWIVLVALVARAALAVEPAVALASGFALVVALVLFVRGAFELTMATWRALFCGLAVLVFDGWLVLVQHVRGQAEGASLVLALLALVPVALTSALVSLAFGSVLAHLPGLTPLRGRRW
jgi:hypothetical protein